MAEHRRRYLPITIQGEIALHYAETIRAILKGADRGAVDLALWNELEKLAEALELCRIKPENLPDGEWQRFPEPNRH